MTTLKQRKLLAADPFSMAASPAESPFAGLETQESPAKMSEKAIDQTARMAAIALSPGEELHDVYQDTVAKYGQYIEQYGDNALRAEAATNQQLIELRQLNRVIHSTNLGFDDDGELREGARLAADHALNESIERRQEYALEKATLERIQDLAMAGDTTQAKVLMNHVEYGSADDIIRDINVKKMIIAREVEKAQVDVESQGWFRHAVDFLASAIGDVTFNNSMDRNNIVDIDDGMKGWFDWLLSGKRYRAEAATLWDKNPADFAKAIREQVIPRVKDHSNFFGYQNQTQLLNLLSGMADTPSTHNINIGDSMVLAGLLPFTKIGKVTSIPYVMARSGARKEAAEALATTTLASLRDGPKAATKMTGISTDEVVENIVPTAMNVTGPEHIVPLTGDTLAAIARGKELLKRLPRIMQGSRLTEQELATAIAKERDRVEMEIGRPLKDFKTSSIKLTDGSQTVRFEFLIGKKKGGGFASQDGARTEATRQGIANPEFVSDGGQWFIKETRDLNESGFYTTNLNPGLNNTGIVGRMFLGARQIDDELIAGQSRQAANARNRMVKSLRNEFHTKLTGLASDERDYLTQAMAWGENKSVWLSRDDLDELFARQGATKPPSDKVYEAYTAARDLNDIEYVLRNDMEWKKRATRGFETVSFESSLIKVDRENALIGRAPDTNSLGRRRVYDINTNTHYHKNNPLTPQELENKLNNGYVVVTLEREQRLADDTEVKHFLMKKSDMKAERLRSDQLPYRAGGHRLYADKYFVKQTVVGKQPDTGEEYLKSPATYIAGTKAEVQAWAKAMEEARQLYVQHKKRPPMDRLEAKLAEVTSLSADDFVKMMQDGRLQSDTPFEAMFDRELPAPYIQATSSLDFVDIEETGFTGWLRTNGRMYYSAKGEALHDWQGDKARTIDPFETTNEAMLNIANLASFSDYRLSAVERWVNTYKDFLDTGALPHNASPLTVFSEAKYRSNVDKQPMGAGLRIKQQMEAQRDIIRRNLGWRSEWDRAVDKYVRDLEDGIMGADPTSRRHRVGRAVTEWWAEANPLNAARGLAFDMKMGLFNIAQFPLQIQTMVAAVALSPTHGVQAMTNIPWMRLYLTKGGSEATLSHAIKMGAADTLGMTPDAYKQMMRAAKESGFFDFGGSHQLINSQGPSVVVGGFRDGWDKFTRAGRFFFNEGEVWNRMTAWQIAWKEQLGSTGSNIPMVTGRASPRIGTDFMRKVALRADDYSLNMMQQSSAAWQHGIASIPTQFWAYNARMLEALLGKQFTPAQKMRLLAAQTFFYGAAGAPLVGVPMALMKAHKGEDFELNTPMGFLDRGALDHILYNVFGADMLMGKRYGTGTWLADLTGELFGLSPYGEKSFVEVFGGATFGILGSTGDTLLDLVNHVVAESGSDDYPLVKEDLQRLAGNVSTYSYGMKAYMALQYGMLVSNTGTVIATDLPTADAFWLWMGIQPGEQDDIAAAMAWKKNKKKAVDEAAKYISDHRARMEVEVTRRQEIAKEVNAFMRLLPPDIRAAALKEANNRTPRSLHEGLAIQMEKEKAQREALNGVTN